MGAATGRFRRSDRLLDSRDYRRVMRGGRRRANGDLVVISAPKVVKPRENGDLRGSVKADQEVVPPSNRIGITASRKVGGAVVRNLFKRRIREWFRMRRDDLGENRDFVVIARRSGASLSLPELDRCLSGLLKIDRSPVWLSEPAIPSAPLRSAESKNGSGA
ncbi:MAG: ribonuclease P protein component [Myxococcota bacterium]